MWEGDVKAVSDLLELMEKSGFGERKDATGVIGVREEGVVVAVIVQQEMYAQSAFRIRDGIGLLRPEYIFPIDGGGLGFWEMKDCNLLL